MEKNPGQKTNGQKNSDQQTREERLAAKLRENLHRRKAQARAAAATSEPPVPLGDDYESDRLPKSPPQS